MKNYNEETNCYKCHHSREVPGDAHIKCIKPDTQMTGDAHGIKEGWFFYPWLFDPIWKTKKCCNYEPKHHAVSGAVSGAVSDVRPMT